MIYLLYIQENEIKTYTIFGDSCDIKENIKNIEICSPFYSRYIAERYTKAFGFYDIGDIHVVSLCLFDMSYNGGKKPASNVKKDRYSILKSKLLNFLRDERINVLV